MFFQLGGHPAEGAARHAGGDGRNTRFVPTDAGVDEGHPHLLQRLAKGDHFLKGRALLHQIQHGEAEDNDEVGADPLANGANNLHRETHPVFAAAAPAIGAFVGTLADELVDEIAFRPHHLDAVITGRLGQRCCSREVADGAADLPLAHGARLERGDGRLEGARRQTEGMVGVATGMEDLQRYLAPLLMHGAGHLLVLAHLPGEAQLGAVRHQPTAQIGGDTAGDDKSNATAGPLGIEGSQLVKTALLLFEASVHGAHQHTVAQLGKTKVKGRQQMGIATHDAFLFKARVHGTTPNTQLRSWVKPRSSGVSRVG